LAVPDKMKIVQENSIMRLSEGNSAVYCRLVAVINPHIMGPSVCPISIIVARKPMDAPTNSLGTSLLTKAGVKAVTVAKPKPYTAENKRRTGNAEIKGIISKGKPPTTQSTTTGIRLPILSETSPIYGWATICIAVKLPIIMPVKNKSK